MNFVVEYDRASGRIVTFEEFLDEDRERADRHRIELEAQLTRAHVSHEVVLLEAESGQDLRRTHRRYFEDLTSLTDRIIAYPTVQRKE